MKQTKLFLTTIAMLLCSVMANAHDFEVDGIYYNILSSTDLTAEVTHGDNKYTGDVIIPSTVNYKSRDIAVIAIGDSAFLQCYKLTNIIIPANSECYIPDKIFNYTLSAEEKECLRSKGRLDKSIQVVVEQSKQVILPFIDEETNQVMHRSMNQVKIPKEFKGVKLTLEHIKNLIGGGDIYIVIDKTMERVFIDPKTGKLISEIEEPLPF